MKYPYANLRPGKSRIAGFGLIELMIAMALGLIVLAGALVVFSAQRQVYQSSSSQSLIQDADNALAAIITPVIRGAGFTGCGSIGNGAVTYVAVHPTPLTWDTSSATKGFKATTMPATIIDGAANDATAADWTPVLDASFATAGGVEKGSDVLVLVGAPPGASPVGVTSFGALTMTVNDASKFTTVPQMMAVSDCGKSSIFQITAANVGTGVLTYAAGPNGTPLYPVSSQLIPIQQTAFYIATGHAGQSALFEAVMTGPAATAIWKVNELVPGVSNMQVLYGTNIGGNTAQYVDAAHVADWTTVTSVKLGFLIEGSAASSNAATNQTSFTLFGQALALPVDSRLRHTFYMTVNTRNSTLL